MKVEILREAGYYEALLGISLSRDQPLENMYKVAKNLSGKDGGHNGFLEFIDVWLDVTAPRYWWQQMDTYDIGVSRLSESTMHTIMKRPLEASDFQHTILPVTLFYLNSLIASGAFELLKWELSEGFLQRRILKLNYQVLRTIWKQRKNHRLAEWHQFLEIINQLEHKELLPDESTNRQ